MDTGLVFVRCVEVAVPELYVGRPKVCVHLYVECVGLRACM
jgi:hypothetical protein